jgi:iron-regulated transporter 1
LLWLLVGVVPITLARVTAQLNAAGTSPAAAPSAPLLQGASEPLIYVLLTGLVASRFGLWLFDLAVSQLQQELVPDSELGELFARTSFPP